MIKDYSTFKHDFDFNSFINESMVYLSPKFRDTLSKIDSPISQKILDLQGVDIKDDISFIDLSDVEGMFSFKTMKNFKKSFDDTVQYAIKKNSPLKDVYPAIGTDFGTTNKLVDDLFKTEDDSILQSRNPFKIGRFINAVLPNQFSNKEIEDFTNKYKSIQLDNQEKFVVVEGEEIGYWYDSRNYLQMVHTLGTSCMRNVSSTFFEIYIKNPEVCKLVCLIKENKLVGRALLWKPTSMKKVRQDYTKPDEPVSFEWFMDRQYATSDAYIQKFRDYANKNGWAYKSTNSVGNVTGVTLKGSNFLCDMQIQLKKISYKQFPYMDTFKKLDPDSCVLYNDEDDSEEGYYMLTSTGGSYTPTGRSEDDDDIVWSEYYGDHIDRDYAVWSDAYDSYLHIDDAVEVTSGSRRYRDWYPSGASELRWDGWNEESLHEDDAIYSEEYDYYLLESEAVSVVNRIQTNGDCDDDMYFIHKSDFGDVYPYAAIKYSELKGLLWFDTLTKHFQNYQVHEGILKSCLFKDGNQKWCPSDFSVTVHQIKGREDVWLSTEDMEILDLDDWTTYKEIDKISYSQSLIDNGVIEELIQVLSTKSKENKPHEESYFEKKRLEQLIQIRDGKFPDYSV